VRDVFLLSYFLTAGCASLASAVDHVVEFRCDSTEARFEIVPSHLVVTAGIDRIVFRSPRHGEAQPCNAAYQHTHFSVYPWGDDGLFVGASLWYADSESPPQGPFCEPSTRGYLVWLVNSNLSRVGDFGPGTVEVVSPEGGSITPSTTIGIFAEAAAETCVLPVSPGLHRAYVCARLDGEGGYVAMAEFRVAGFPADWRVTTIPGPGFFQTTGDPLGDGVQTHGPDVFQSPGVVVLYWLDYDASSLPSNRILEVQAANLPGRKHPRIHLSDNGSIRETCARGGRASLGGDVVSCSVAVQPTSWSFVRSLFR